MLCFSWLESLPEILSEKEGDTGAVAERVKLLRNRPKSGSAFIGQGR